MGSGGGAGGSAGIRFPKNPAQTKHIFRQKEGHLANDSYENRKLFLDVANNRQNYQGTDKRGVDWYSKTNPGGSQIWVKVKNNVISGAGVNRSTSVWDNETGFDRNPNRR